MKTRSVEDIDREMQALQLEREGVLRAEEERRHHDQLLEARGLTETVLQALGRLDELGHTPPKIREALTDERGKFSPGKYIKRPRMSGESQSL